jgi:tetratricopeptide (TPR) repeat protein
LGRVEDCEDLLAKYRNTIPVKNARYIQYCDLRCYFNWSIGNYPEAIKWGKEGKLLKQKSNVDTNYDSEHNLSLAQRDNGDVDEALTYFLGGKQIDEVLDPDDVSEKLGGSYYGNIGRCLHFMGQSGPALICYRKSALLIEKSPQTEHVLNQGYIRQWIGELLAASGDNRTALAFIDAAVDKWNSVSPPRAEKLMPLREALISKVSVADRVPLSRVERFCVAWIYGREAVSRAA